jgi:hypothetical protein
MRNEAVVAACIVAACGTGAPWAVAQPGSGPTLSIPTGLPATPGGDVVVPIAFAARGADVASLVFSIDYDTELLTVDPTDADDDGSPDAVAFHLPGGFVTTVLLDPADADGELDIVITDLLPPLSRLPDGDLVKVTFATADSPAPITTPIRFSSDPSPSFGSTTGSTVAGTWAEGSVRIGAAPAASISLPRLVRGVR